MHTPFYPATLQLFVVPGQPCYDIPSTTTTSTAGLTNTFRGKATFRTGNYSKRQKVWITKGSVCHSTLTSSIQQPKPRAVAIWCGSQLQLSFTSIDPVIAGKKELLQSSLANGNFFSRHNLIVLRLLLYIWTGIYLSIFSTALLCSGRGTHLDKAVSYMTIPFHTMLELPRLLADKLFGRGFLRLKAAAFTLAPWVLHAGHRYLSIAIGPPASNGSCETRAHRGPTQARHCPAKTYTQRCQAWPLCKEEAWHCKTIHRWLSLHTGLSRSKYTGTQATI